MAMYSVAVSAMIVILADGTSADGTFPGIALAGVVTPSRSRSERGVARRPQPVHADSEHRHEETDRERRPRVAVRPVEAGEGGDGRDGDLGGQQAVQDPAGPPWGGRPRGAGQRTSG